MGNGEQGTRKEKGDWIGVGEGLGDWELIVITLESHIGGYKNVDSVTGGTSRCGEEGRVESNREELSGGSGDEVIPSDKGTRDKKRREEKRRKEERSVKT